MILSTQNLDLNYQLYEYIKTSYRKSGKANDNEIEIKMKIWGGKVEKNIPFQDIYKES